MSALDSARNERPETGKDPDAFRTISEVADDLDIPQHVLRFWETRFGQIKPMKRGGGRRYYRPDDVDLLRGIRHLLYGEGYTIRGVQKLLKQRGVKFVQSVWLPGGAVALKEAAARGDVDEDQSGDEQDAEGIIAQAEVVTASADAAPAQIEPSTVRAPAEPAAAPASLMRSLATPLPLDKNRAEPPLARPLSPALGSGAPTNPPVVASKPELPAKSDTRVALEGVLRELGECRKLLNAALKAE
jgi:DNA-binding transcriptional MerR regulator